MNFKDILLAQQELDKTIEETHNVSGAELINEKVLALLVEIAEFANEIAPFKYWKKNKVINKDSMIEEFVDGIHFFLSIGLHIGIDTEIKPRIVSQDQTIQLLEIYNALTTFNNDRTKEKLTTAFELYMGISELLGLTSSDIEDFYNKKNQKNHNRIKNNY